MLAKDRDAVICDLAETYGVFDYRALPVPLLATLCCGLREDSRIRMRMVDARVRTEIILQAMAVDYLALLHWAQTKDAMEGRNRPRSVVSLLLGEVEQGSDVVTFETAEEFDAARKKILEVDRGERN